MALVYDVGVHNGSDSAYYLRRGHHVVAVEANPALAERLAERFAAEIRDGRYILLNVGIAASSGRMDFWVSDVTEWSSFNVAIASRNGTPHRALSVPTRTFDQLLAEHGVPLYCKIDIEGHDSLCLEAMTPSTAPTYVSVEMSHAGGDRDIELMTRLGYDRFKLISQVTFAPAHRATIAPGYHLPAKAGRIWRKGVRRLFGVTSVDGWWFPPGSSGSFGEDTPGHWQSAESALTTWRFLCDIDRAHKNQGLGEWFDIHASKAA